MFGERTPSPLVRLWVLLRVIRWLSNLIRSLPDHCTLQRSSTDCANRLFAQHVVSRTQSAKAQLTVFDAVLRSDSFSRK